MLIKSSKKSYQETMLDNFPRHSAETLNSVISLIPKEWIDERKWELGISIGLLTKYFWKPSKTNKFLQIQKIEFSYVEMMILQFLDFQGRRSYWIPQKAVNALVCIQSFSSGAKSFEWISTEIV